MKSYYEILGVEQNATAEEIKSRYLFLVKVYHPDRFTDQESKKKAEDELKQINFAYGVLSNPKKRQDYDAQNRISTEKEATNHKDEEDQEQFYLAIEYIQQVKARWNYILDRSPNVVSSMGSYETFHKLVVTLVYKLLPYASESQKKSIIEEISLKVITVILVNIMLGAEYEEFGINDQLSPGFVQFTSTYLVIRQLHDLLIKGRLEYRITESESARFLEQVTNNISIICQISEAIGRNLVLKQTHAEPTPTYTSESNNRDQSKANSSDENKPNENTTSRCQFCHAYAPTEEVEFNQTIGVIVARFRKKIEGRLCASCIEKNFWEMTGKTLLFGWFSVLSFITTPFYLVDNIVNYRNTSSLRKSSSNLASIAGGWKFAIFLSLATIIFGVMFIASGNNTGTKAQEVLVPTKVRNTSVPTRTPSPTKKPTETAYVYKTATPDNCRSWNKVSKNDKGKRLCVYGTVKKAYWGDNIFFMTFGDGLYDFRMLVFNGYYYKNIQGKCVRVEGVIKIYQDLPYIEVNDNLLNCP